MSDLGSAADGAVKKLQARDKNAGDQVEPAPLGCCALPFPRGFGSFSLRTASIKWRRQWAGIERAMNCANRNSAFRPPVESLVNSYFGKRRADASLRFEEWGCAPAVGPLALMRSDADATYWHADETGADKDLRH